MLFYYRMIHTISFRHSLIILALATGLLLPPPVHAHQAQAEADTDAARFVLDYATALAQSDVAHWAAADLACMSRVRSGPEAPTAHLPAEVAQRCWDDTVHAHIAMVTQQTERGVFNATERGSSLGLLHDRHRTTEHWKEYPPALFISPPVILKNQAPIPLLSVIGTTPPHPIALTHINGTDPVSVQGQAVDVKIIYRDPLTAPLALRPEEVWWSNGSQRRFGPVREVVARFIVVTDLRRFGYSVDRAVMNEVLPDSPRIPTTHYGLRPNSGRKFDYSDTATHSMLKGELVPGSAHWWKRDEAAPAMRAALDQAKELPATERSTLLTRLLLIDPDHVETHTLRGEDNYQAFLHQGVEKGALAARDTAALHRIAELYWTIQAQTWRQELTAVSEGYEPAADALYRALASYEAVARQPHATPEQRRRLGALTRWNNDSIAALEIHESLLRDTQAGTPEYGRVLTDIVWDRIQWVSWERRYDHPWLQQADKEAEQAAQLATNPSDRLSAHYARVAVESLLVPRNLERFNSRLQLIKQDLDQIADLKGLQSQLLANDLVKALSPESAAIVLPTSPRSTEVLDVAIHATPPKQDIVWRWNFDQDQLGTVPAGFIDLMSEGNGSAHWRVQAYDDASSDMQRLVKSSHCSTTDCVRLLVADQALATYPDIMVQVRTPVASRQEEAGIAVAVRDPRNYYAITLNPLTGQVTTRRMVDGVPTILGHVSVQLVNQPWHSIRVQRINFLHLDKGRLAVFIDGVQVSAVEDTVLPQEGRVGLIAIGNGESLFDSLHLLDLVSNRTFSKPAAY